MKRESLLWVLLIIMTFISGTVGSDELTVNLESRVIESWDGADSGYFSDTGEPISWQVRGSRFSIDNRPRTAYAMNEWPLDLFGSAPEDPEELGVIGVNGAFARQDFNHVELIPGVGSGDDFLPKAIPLPGRVQTLDFWLWGSNRDYLAEVHFRDYRGVVHTLVPVQNENLRYPGSMKFVGWKNMFVLMPSYITQAMNYSAKVSNLSLTKFVFKTHPAEIVTDFYIYIDHLKVLSELRESFYDGFDLTSTERIEEVWGLGE